MPASGVVEGVPLRGQTGLCAKYFPAPKRVDKVALQIYTEILSLISVMVRPHFGMPGAFMIVSD